MIMSRVSIDYSEIIGSATSARSASRCYEAYANQLERNVSNRLANVPGSDSKGNIGSARNVITIKVRDLRNKKSYLSTLAGNIERMANNIKIHEKQVETRVRSIATDAFELKNQSKWDEFTQWLYGTVCVDLVNWNPVTRAIANTVKKGVNWVKEKGTKVIDWFKHGEGRYILGIVGDVLEVTSSIIGLISSVGLVIATGGAALPLVISALATMVGTGMLAIDAMFSIDNKLKALKIAHDTDDPGRARFYGDINGVNDKIHKSDIGGKDANNFLEAVGDGYDIAHKAVDKTAEVTGFIGKAGLTGGAKLDPKTGKYQLEVKYDSSRIKDNIKSMFMEKIGFKNKNGKWTFDIKNLFDTKHRTGAKAKADLYVKSGTKKAYTEKGYKALKWIKKTAGTPKKIQKTAKGIETIYSSYTSAKDKVKSTVDIMSDVKFKVFSPIKNFKKSINWIIDFAM